MLRLLRRIEIDGWRLALPVALVAMPLVSACTLAQFGASHGRETDQTLRAADQVALVLERHDEWAGEVDLAPRRAGATVAVRNRNPLNLKYGSGTRHFVDSGLAAISHIVPLDGGRFLRFDSAVAGFRAAADLLVSPRYADLQLDRALRRWSNNGYGADILARTGLDGQTTVPSLERDGLAALLRAMATAEGYRSGGLSNQIDAALSPRP